jgi:hypothetical protein
MKLNSESKTAWFYRYYYAATEMPRNFCDYFWALAFAMITTPFVWPALLWNRYHNNVAKSSWGYTVHYRFMQTAIGAVISFVFFVIGALGLNFIYAYELTEWGKNFNTFHALFVIYFAGVFFSILIGIGIYSIVKLFMILLPYFQKIPKPKFIKRKKEVSTSPNIFQLAGIAYKSYKEKNCPLIDWQETQEN